MVNWAVKSEKCEAFLSVLRTHLDLCLCSCVYQLRERLALFQEEEREKEERKRDDIIEAKQVTENTLSFCII